MQIVPCQTRSSGDHVQQQSQAAISWFSLKCRQNTAWELTLGISIHVMQIPSLVRRKQNRPGFSTKTTTPV